MYYKNGSIYIGRFKDSEMCGEGTFYIKNDSRYIGSFKGNKKSGEGILYTSDTEYYVGTFSNDKKNGKGIMHFNNKVVEEEWTNGQLVNSTVLKADEKLSQKQENEEIYDLSFDNYLEDQLNAEARLEESKKPYFTLGIAKYFNAKIPNNYFDCLRILTFTSDLFYAKPDVVEWTADYLAIFFTRLELVEYDILIRGKNLNGNQFLKLDLVKIYNLGVHSRKDLKTFLKVVEFLRMYTKLKIDLHESILMKKKNEKESRNKAFSGKHVTFNLPNDDKQDTNFDLNEDDTFFRTKYCLSIKIIS